MQYTKDYRVYKPNKNMNGGALALSLSENGLFLSLAKQNGERSFDWQNKIVMKVNESDVEQLRKIANGKYQVQNGQSPKEASIFHSNNTGMTKIINLTYSAEFDGYYMSISQKVGETSGRAGLPLSKEEVRTIIQLGEYAIPVMLGWNQVKTDLSPAPAGGAGQYQQKPVAPQSPQQPKEELPIIELEQPSSGEAPSPQAVPGIDPVPTEMPQDDSINLEDIPF